MTQLKIKVTKEILEKSKDCMNYEVNTNCAIALAVRDVFPNAEISSDVIYTNHGSFDIIELPEEAQEFIIKFDKTVPSERTLLPELEFTVEIPDSVINKINIEELRPLLQNHPTLELC